MKMYRSFFLFFLSLNLLACQDDKALLSLSVEEKARVLAIQNPFGKHFAKLDTPKGMTYLGLRECKVYKAEIEKGVIVEWQQVFSPPAVGFFPSCDEQSIYSSDGYIEIKIRRVSFGAGGAPPELFRTVDGVKWVRYKP